MIRWICWLAAAVVVVWPVRLQAEVIHLKSGDKVAGEIVKRDEQSLVVKVGGIELTIPLSEVSEVVGEQPKPTPTPISIPVLSDPFQRPGDLQETIDLPSFPLPEASGQISAASFPELPLLPVVLPSGRTYRVKGSAVRFRDGPGLDYEVVDTLIRGTLLMAVQEVSDWVRAWTLDGLEGWMNKDYLEPLANIPVVVTVDRLNLRDGPGSAYRTIQRLRRGDVLILLNEQGDWWRVQSPTEKVGWCSGEYLVKVESLEIVRPRLAETHTASVRMDRSALPTGPGERLTLSTTDTDFVVRGLTKVIAFHRESNTLSKEAEGWTG
ncbi:MAG: SH3 domain-containing protein, partial [bacterium]